MAQGSNKLKIAVIGLKGLPAFGGAAAVGEAIIEQLKDEYDFTVYSISSHTDLKSGRYKTICYQKVFKALPLKKINSLYYYIISALHAVFCGKYDLVHLHHRDAAFILLLLKLKYKTIITTHGSFFVRPKWIKYKLFFQINEKYFVKYADVITCVSRNEQRLYKNLLNINVHYIPNGINVLDNKIPIERKDYIFFGAGRIIKSKGCEIMLKALNILHYSGKILIAGDLDQTPDYKKEILNLAKNLNVDFLGLIKNKKDLLSIIGQAKLFIFPSSIEAMSMMLLEAASVKTPIIASDIIGNKDIFNEDEVLFFKTDNPSDLAEKIKWALSNYDEMLLKSNKAYMKLVQQYNWNIIADKYKKIYNELLY
ncbi:MAG: glycosyltransferase family 4 protein [Promethearchaeota archaeon]